ncbi:MAG: hypothetical protein HY455_00470 [Parcubacteria group bacterium]|nr:hypothetical protein [Parcubacteria group bacterium]
MNIIDPQKFRTLYKNLPENVKEAYSSVGVTEQIENIGKKYNLHVDKIADLNDEVGWVMIGATHPKDFVGKIADRLGVDAGSAHTIATDINEQIFRPIRESLKKIHQITGDSSSVETVSDNQVAPKSTVPAIVTGGAVGNTDTTKSNQAFEPKASEKAGDVPENLPEETEGEPAPEIDKEYPITEPIESKLELLQMIEGGQESATLPTPKNESVSSGITPSAPTDLVRTQLQETVHTPHEKVEHYGEGDPYREPIE